MRPLRRVRLQQALGPQLQALLPGAKPKPLGQPLLKRLAQQQAFGPINAFR